MKDLAPFIVGLLVGILVAFSAGYIIGGIKGSTHLSRETNEYWHKELIDRGHMRYNSKTGQIEWIENNEDRP